MRNLLLCFIICQFSTFAQQEAWVYLSDKPNAATQLAAPITILTQAAIDRKTNHAIAIDERDAPVHEPYITLLKESIGITYKAKSKWFNAVHVIGEESAINALLTVHDFIDYIDFADSNLNARVGAVQDKFQLESNLTDFTYGSTQNQVEMIHVDALHTADYTGDGVVVAVIDAGFPNVDTMTGFERLRTAGNLMGGYDFVNKTADVYNSTASDHGTKVLSTMAGYIENQYVGTAPDATFYVFLTEDVYNESPLEESYWVEAVERADSLGVQIINTSLGYKDFDNSNYDYSDEDLNGTTTYISRGANIAFEKGLILITSAGNSGASGISAPGDAAGVLTIAAVDGNGNYASFSSQGSVLQPTHKPDVAARGSGSYVINKNNQITQSNGTSFSSPILAGGVASLVQALPNATNAEIYAYVRESASQYTIPDFFIGYGIPDFDNALTLGLENQFNSKLDFEIFPNPVISDLVVKFPDSISSATIMIHNLLGQSVYENQLESMQPIRMEALSNGLYVLTICTATQDAVSFKVIKE